MVVVSKTTIKKTTNSGDESNEPEPMATAKALLICRPNSHAFDDRTVSLDKPLKIGRSVARAKPDVSNGIFDCKVLSRHHALLWYEDSKFFLQDTKSSNGTFINNHRLSETNKESTAREVTSGDVVQFGVDVVENCLKVTHSCIIATLKLYYPNGEEAKRGTSVALTIEDRVSSHLLEALQSERLLQTKLVNLQRLVEQTKQATELGWKAAIEEDRLLSRISFLETQLRTLTSKADENTLRDEILQLQEDKQTYQQSAKELLQQLNQDRLEILDRVTYLEQTLRNAQTDCAQAQTQVDASEREIQALNEQLTECHKTSDELAGKVQEMEVENETLHQKINELKEEEDSVKVQLNVLIKFLNNPEIIHSLRDEMQQLRTRLNNHEDEKKDTHDENDGQNVHVLMKMTQVKLDILESVYPLVYNNAENNETLKQQLQNEQVQVKQLDVENDDLRAQLLEAQQTLKVCRNEAQQLQDRVKLLLDELEVAQAQTRVSDDKKMLEMRVSELENDVSVLTGELERVNADRVDGEVNELQSELVMIKEMHARCPIELSKCRKEMQVALDNCRVLSQRSNSFLFCIIAPFVICLAYLYLTRHV